MENPSNIIPDQLIVLEGDAGTGAAELAQIPASWGGTAS